MKVILVMIPHATIMPSPIDNLSGVLCLSWRSSKGLNSMRHKPYPMISSGDSSCIRAMDTGTV